VSGLRWPRWLRRGGRGGAERADPGASGAAAVEYRSSGVAGGGGLPVAVDWTAETADPGRPGFLARPPGAPVYHGFTVLDDVVVDGFTLGVITAMGPATYGDAFVIAPDDSRAGLVWEVGAPDGRLHATGPFEHSRWGVWGAVFPRPMASEEDARENLRAIAPALRATWEEWKAWRAEQAE
jgi:hypothetical protein